MVAVFFDYLADLDLGFSVKAFLYFLNLNVLEPSAHFGQKENRVGIQPLERCLYTKAAGYSLPIILLELQRRCTEK